MVVIVALIARVDNSNTPVPTVSKSEQTPAGHTAMIKAKVHDYAVDQISPDQYPTLYKKLGKKGAAEATAGSYAAALRLLPARTVML